MTGLSNCDGRPSSRSNGLVCPQLQNACIIVDSLPEGSVGLPELAYNVPRPIEKNEGCCFVRVQYHPLLDASQLVPPTTSSVRVTFGRDSNHTKISLPMY